jgi:hypothetical protein
MINKRRITASVLGVYAGLLGVIHGWFEILQANTRPQGLLIQAMGPYCQPDAFWHACLPAMTIVPSFRGTGILACLVGLGVIVWSLAFIATIHGGRVLAALSIVLLLVGGGFVPLWVGLLAGLAGSRIGFYPPWNWLRSKLPGRLLAALWPWPLVLLMIWLPGSWVLGYFFSGIMLNLGVLLFLGFDVGLPVLAVLVGMAGEARKAGS